MLDVLDVVQFARPSVVDVNGDDLPIRLAVVDHAQHAENLYLARLADADLPQPDLADVQRVVVATHPRVRVDEVGVFPKNCSTIWCEATASLSFELAEPAFASDSTDEASQDDHEATESGSPQPSLLLCLRRRGDGPPVAEELRPVPPPRRQERERPLAAQGPAQVRLHAPTTAHAEPTAARTPAASLPLDSAVAREPPAASGAARSAQAAKPWLTADARRVQPVLTTRGASPAKPAHLPTPALGGGGSGRVSTDVQHAVESLMSIGGLRMP
jgi:hypothetical protein